MKSKYKLGVNIDHVATLRNARGENFPSVLLAANNAINAGADSITVHLREDQRHIKPAGRSNRRLRRGPNLLSVCESVTLVELRREANGKAPI